MGSSKIGDVAVLCSSITPLRCAGDRCLGSPAATLALTAAFIVSERAAKIIQQDCSKEHALKSLTLLYMFPY